MRLIDADKLKTTAVLGVQLQHADSRYYYFYEEETIDKAPTVKAIPIEWLERKGMILAANKYDFSAGVIRIVIKEWEKENGRSE